MKVTSILFFCSFFSCVFSQHEAHVAGGRFIKKVEYNFLFLGAYNLDSKGDVEKLFFGDVNAPVEFFYLPSSEAAYKEAYSSFRIVKDTSNTNYNLEVKYISNYREAQKEAQKQHPIIGTNLTTEHNKAALAKQNEESFKLYKIETRSLHINNQFAERLYKKIVSLIDNFKAKGVPPIILDGYSVTFRTVVEDEVWSLSIHMPKGDALKMADLCRQIITDANAGELDESKYIEWLE